MRYSGCYVTFKYEYGFARLFQLRTNLRTTRHARLPGNTRDVLQSLPKLNLDFTFCAASSFLLHTHLANFQVTSPSVGVHQWSSH